MEQVKTRKVPKILVETWVLLARNPEADNLVKRRALSMLKNALGTPENIAAYMKKHNIK